MGAELGNDSGLTPTPWERQAVSDPAASRRRSMPLWLWLTLALLVYAFSLAVIGAIGDSLGWPHRVHTVIRGGAFALWYFIVSPRVSRAWKAFRERRHSRRQP